MNQGRSGKHSSPLVQSTTVEIDFVSATVRYRPLSRVVETPVELRYSANMSQLYRSDVGVSGAVKPLRITLSPSSNSPNSGSTAWSSWPLVQPPQPNFCFLLSVLIQSQSPQASALQPLSTLWAQPFCATGPLTATSASSRPSVAPYMSPGY